MSDIDPRLIDKLSRYADAIDAVMMGAQAALELTRPILTTPDELDALPTDSIVMDAHGDPHRSIPRPGRQANAWMHDGYQWCSDDLPLPCRLLWRGGS